MQKDFRKITAFYAFPYAALIMVVPVVAASTWERYFTLDKAIEYFSYYWSFSIAGMIVTFWLYPMWILLGFIGFSGIKNIAMKSESMTTELFIATHSSLVFLISLPDILLRLEVLPYVGP